MKSPITGKEMKLLKENRKLSFRREQFDILFHSYLCEESGETFESEEQSELNVTQVYNKYREKHHLPFPDGIRSIRLKYGLAAAKISEILGFGINTYRNYENGEVPSTSNARLLQIAEDPVEFINLVKLSGVYNERDFKKVEKKMNLLIEEEKSCSLFEESFLGTGSPDELNGYHRLNLKKVYNIILFFAQNLSPWKTQLNKLLFYSDFIHFKNTCYSITGLNYRAIPLGPVPNNFDILFTLAESENYCELEYNSFFKDSPSVRFLPFPSRQFNKELFSNTELSTLDDVLNNYGGLKTGEIVKLSHKEKGWIDNEKKKSLINYYSSFDLLMS